MEHLSTSKSLVNHQFVLNTAAPRWPKRCQQFYALISGLQWWLPVGLLKVTFKFYTISEIINSLMCAKKKKPCRSSSSSLIDIFLVSFRDKERLLWQRWDHKAAEMLTSSLLSLYNAFPSRVLDLPLLFMSPEVAAFPPTQGRGHCRDTAAYTC